MSTQSPRYYSAATRNLLWSLSGGVCAFPHCNTKCVEPPTDDDPPVTTGVFAHIESSSDNGPRANPSLSPAERDSYDNLLILCATHHELVDGQVNTYTVEMLHKWKKEQEDRYAAFLAQAVSQITFAELKVVTDALVNGEQPPPSPIVVIPPADKMARNGLTRLSTQMFTMGMAQTRQVESFVESMGSLDRTFVGRLISGFTNQYQKQKQSGLEGDALFAAMQRFSAQGSIEVKYQGAGLAVLVYLFERCEVFER